jgi:hypothetical protein
MAAADPPIAPVAKYRCFVFHVFQRAYFFACSGWAYSILADFDAADDPMLDRIVLHLVDVYEIPGTG